MLSIASLGFFYVVLLSSATFLAPGAAKGSFLQKPPRAIGALLGGTVDFLHASGWLATAMYHPVTLALFASSALAISSGAVASELERGTIDFVLTRPVGRRSFLLSKAAASVVAVTLVQIGGLLAVLIARLTVKNVDQLSLAAIGRAFLGSWLLFLSVAMIGLLISAASSLRGRVLAAATGVVVAGYFINFVALLFQGAYWLRLISPFHYFQPSEVIAGQSMWNLGALAAMALVAAAAAVLVFSRRDLTR